ASLLPASPLGNREGRQPAETREPGDLPSQAGPRSGTADEDHPASPRIERPLGVNEVRGASAMGSFLASILSDRAGNLRGRIVGLYVLLVTMNVGAWLWALWALRDFPLLLGTAVLAYTFGLRDALGPDHIAAIDNVTRTLMQAGKRPIAAGFFFSIGHSVVILAMSAAVAVAARAVEARFADFKAIGALLGTGISAFFLFAIALVNAAIFVSVYRTFRSVRAGAPLLDEDLNALLSGRGLLARLFRPLFRIVGRSWHLLPVGLLFGLGFDTATEVGLFGISAVHSADGMALSVVLVFPALFAAAMALVDTTDSVLMVGAYGWAFARPLRKLFYNMAITLASALVAVVIGGIETLGLLADELDL